MRMNAAVGVECTKLDFLSEAAKMATGVYVMCAFGKIATIGQVWLTAIMVPVAGLPHFDCRCPNGQVKHFCIGMAAKASGCCCGSACCSSSAAGKCCCGSHAGACDGQSKRFSCCKCQHNRGATSGRQTLERSGCTKTAVRAGVFAASDGKATADLSQAGLPLTPCLLTPDLSGEVVTAHLRWQKHLPAPPPDVLNLLQRLLI